MSFSDIPRLCFLSPCFRVVRGDNESTSDSDDELASESVDSSDDGLNLQGEYGMRGFWEELEERISGRQAVEGRVEVVETSREAGAVGGTAAPREGRGVK